jgi:hypothetical protein
MDQHRFFLPQSCTRANCTAHRLPATWRQGRSSCNHRAFRGNFGTPNQHLAVRRAGRPKAAVRAMAGLRELATGARARVPRTPVASRRQQLTFPSRTIVFPNYGRVAGEAPLPQAPSEDRGRPHIRRVERGPAGRAVTANAACAGTPTKPILVNIAPRQFAESDDPLSSILHVQYSSVNPKFPYWTSMYHLVQAFVTLSTLPSGSLNQATLTVPPGTVKMPSSS